MNLAKKYKNQMADASLIEKVAQCTRVIECDTPIPETAKHALQANHEYLVKFMDLKIILSFLKEEQVISRYHEYIINKIINKDFEQAITYLLDILINGNNEQYIRFKHIIATHHYELLSYI